MAEAIVIAKIKKSTVSEVWVAAKEYNGRPLCDIREYFHPADNPEWLPTKKGASVSPDLLAQVVDAVEAMATRDAVGEVCEIPRGKRRNFASPSVNTRSTSTATFGPITQRAQRAMTGNPVKA